MCVRVCVRMCVCVCVRMCAEERWVLRHSVRVTSAAPHQAPLKIRHLEVTMTQLLVQTMGREDRA